MPKTRIRRYLIDIKDATGQSVVFIAAYWSEKERRAAVAQVLRLDGVPDVYASNELNLQTERGDE